MKAVIVTDCEVKNPQYMAWKITDCVSFDLIQEAARAIDHEETPMIYDKSLWDVYPDEQRDWAEHSIKPNEDMDPIEVILYGITS